MEKKEVAEEHQQQHKQYYLWKWLTFQLFHEKMQWRREERERERMSVRDSNINNKNTSELIKMNE